MTKASIVAVAAAFLVAAPAHAAILFDGDGAAPVRSAAVAGAYLRLPLGPTADVGRAPRAGLHLAMRHERRDPRLFSTSREASLLDLRFSQQAPALLVAGQPISGAPAPRMNAGGASKGRLDKIMIGAGVALGAVAAFFLVSSVAD